MNCFKKWSTYISELGKLVVLYFVNVLLLFISYAYLSVLCVETVASLLS